ncbi:hypothetical protein CKO_04436 [Citrobacter koseri ATCC BAA-895]|uniref:Uncharacterized protein n=1 Tax=Citrobacter koseri (strain ATCC BAA-895 / CDC 4225-83 / SGSC4696) TaxID=290338 RepID=A8APT0_CITK8|nr:hypothetical protein CKO_04436 [Citrobacter koseri ATCC BAA-895]
MQNQLRCASSIFPVTAWISTGWPSACILAKLRARKSKLFNEYTFLSFISIPSSYQISVKAICFF